MTDFECLERAHREAQRYADNDGDAKPLGDALDADERMLGKFAADDHRPQICQNNRERGQEIRVDCASAGQSFPKADKRSHDEEPEQENTHGQAAPRADANQDKRPERLGVGASTFAVSEKASAAALSTSSASKRDSVCRSFANSGVARTSWP